MRHFKVFSLPALLGATLMVVSMPDAVAHDIVVRNHYAYPSPYIDYRRAAPPRWLRRHNDFMRWYRFNRTRIAANAGWHRLYRRYERDYFYHRYMKSRKVDKYERRRFKGRHRQDRYYRN